MSAFSIVCAVCPKTFAYESSCLRHLNSIHQTQVASDAVYECSVCNTCFTSQTYLKAHFDRLHIRGPSLEDLQEVQVPLQLPMVPPRLICKECDKALGPNSNVGNDCPKYICCDWCGLWIPNRYYDVSRHITLCPKRLDVSLEDRCRCAIVTLVVEPIPYHRALETNTWSCLPPLRSSAKTLFVGHSHGPSPPVHCN
jgi:hypothetical protein